MAVLDSQIDLMKERLAELRGRRKNASKQRKPAAKEERKSVTASRRGTAFALRMKGLTWAAVGQRLGLSGSRARQLCHVAERLYRRRKRTPLFHRLDGDGWVAWNCGEWFRSSHPESCVRKDYHFSVAFHRLAD